MSLADPAAERTNYTLAQIERERYPAHVTFELAPRLSAEELALLRPLRPARP